MKEQIIEIPIAHLNSKGRGVGIHSFSESNQSKVEVIGAIPGDVVEAKLWKKKRGKWSADLLKVIHPSTDRQLPRCQHVPLCGGCSLQQMGYLAQLEQKQKWLEAIFAPIINESSDIIQPIVACENPWEYRNKMEFSFSQNKDAVPFFGLVIGGSKGHVFNLEECHLVTQWFSQVVERVRQWWKETGLDAYRRNDTGSLRTLTVREGKKTGQKLVMLTVSGNPKYALNPSQLSAFVTAIKTTLPEESWPNLSIFLQIQQIQKGSPTQFFEMHLFGPDAYQERLDISSQPLYFKISPTSFFQPNTYQAEKLYTEALKCISSRKKHVMDLYAGTATLSLVMASIADQVTAIELNPHACFDAETNLELNKLKNINIICGDVGKTLQELRVRPDFISPDLIIVDPPRMGLDVQALAHIAELQPDEILYISCNPLTQAANIQELITQGYCLTKIIPVDQFPHTVHLETIALLNRTK